MLICPLQQWHLKFCLTIRFLPVCHSSAVEQMPGADAAHPIVHLVSYPAVTEVTFSPLPYSRIISLTRFCS
jgi:hypothetical protein